MWYREGTSPKTYQLCRCTSSQYLGFIEQYSREKLQIFEHEPLLPLCSMVFTVGGSASKATLISASLLPSGLG